MKTIRNIRDWQAGFYPLPFGSVPLAYEGEHDVVCLLADGQWIKWFPDRAAVECLGDEAQREVLAVLVSAFGGTAASLAEALGVSPRTVEAWRQGKSPLPISKAYLIANLLSRA